MEHRHIPASKDGSIPSAKTRFWRGEDNFLEDVWYGRCAICGELIRPPKPWYFIRNVLGYFLTVPYAVIPALIDVPESTALSKALLFTSGFAVLLIIWKLAINACLAFGQWQLLPDGLEGEKLRKRTNRKSEKMWWIVMLFYMGFQWSGAMKNGSMTYFCKWVMDNTFFGTADAWGASQSLLSIMGAVPMAVAAVAIVPLCNKFGKRIVCMVGMLLGSVGGVIAIMGNGQIVPVAIGVALKCLGSAPACYMILAMLADVIDHIEYKSGIRTDGLTMSIYSSIMVAATPVCNSIFSAILNASGYDQAADIALGTAAQTAAAQTAISEIGRASCRERV